MSSSHTLLISHRNNKSTASLNKLAPESINTSQIDFTVFRVSRVPLIDFFFCCVFNEFFMFLIEKHTKWNTISASRKDTEFCLKDAFNTLSFHRCVLLSSSASHLHPRAALHYRPDIRVSLSTSTLSIPTPCKWRQRKMKRPSHSCHVSRGIKLARVRAIVCCANARRGLMRNRCEVWTH